VDKKPVSLDPQLRYVVNDGEALVAAAIAELGLIQVPTYMAAAAVQAGELIEVLAKFRPSPMPISLVYASTRHVPQRLRLLIDTLAQLKSAAPKGRGAAQAK
jgi:LysR family transcriptional regulator, regulator for bpeEF and oprC